MLKLLLCGLAAVCLYAQQPAAADVTVNDGSPRHSYQEIIHDSTSPEYVCQAFSLDPKRSSTSISISAASNANPVSFTSNGHGLHASSRPSVTISGGTGNWAAVNGTHTATVTGANTFTVAVNSSAFGAVAGTLVFSTTAPRTTVAEWAVRLIRYSGTNPVWRGWLNGNPRYAQKCSEAALTTTNIQ